MISRLLQIIDLFCKRARQKRLYSAKETCNVKGQKQRATTSPHYTISRLLQIIGLFCKRARQKRLCSAKETCNIYAKSNHVSAPDRGFLYAKEPYERDYILQKSPIILRSLLIVATPYMIYLVGSFKSQVSFAKEPDKRDYILQKRPVIYMQRASMSAH